ncbi:MAG TPA: esterase-like activity of phytase family protein [Vicinamibacteria bacterium]
MGKRSAVAAAIAVVVATWSAGSTDALAKGGRKPPRLEFLGEAIIPTGTMFGGTTIGGLSSITFDRARGVYYSLSDDQSQLSPARFYTLAVDLSDGFLDDGDVTFVGVTTLLGPDGLPYPPGSLDPEGLTLAKGGELVVTSEGIAARGIAPWVRRYALDGRFLGELPVPDAFQPTSAAHGVRQNLAFEAAAVAPNGRHLFVGMEGALVQDGPAATLGGGSPARILRYNLASRRLERQYVYVTDPVAEPSVPPTAFTVNGLVELLPFNDQFMLSMERSFSVGAPGTGNTIKLYTVAFPGADDVDGLDSIAGVLPDIRTVEKEEILDLGTLGIPLDNVEGMVIGPDLPDGRRSLLLVSDNNFAASQFTQFLLFALD